MLQPGDVINVIVLAGGLQKEFRYRIAATHQNTAKKRVLIVAAEDYKGVSPNVNTAGYDTAPRYVDEYQSSLEALGYEVSVYDVDNPPPTGGTPNGVVFPQIKYPTYLGVLSHFDAVVYESGDDFIPQDVTNTNPRRVTNPTAQTGSQEMAPWFHHAMLQLRDYANEGGKLIVAGRNVHQPATSTSTGLTATGPYTWTPDKLFGFNYPPNNGGDDDLPGTAFQRSRTSSNDTWQNYLGVVGRQGGVGATGQFVGMPVARQDGRPVRGHGELHAGCLLDGRPEPERRRQPAGPAAEPAAAAQLGGRRQHERADPPGADRGRLRDRPGPERDRWRGDLDA